jgi:hypothetical protein
MRGKVIEVSINDQGGGACLSGFRAFIGPRKDDRPEALKMAIAGPLMERRAYSWWNRPSLEETLAWMDTDPRSDGARVKALLGQDDLAKWERKTKSLLWGDEDHVKDLAEALLVYRSLTGAQAEAIFRGRR